jgi:mannose-6-phosphate isomerase-like protein (cupin superfamily)
LPQNGAKSSNKKGMIESTFLNGRVIKRSLAVIQGRPAGDAPRLKRLLLAQGELAQIYDGDEGIRYLAFVELRQGAIRGNHYHEVKDEVIYVIQGEIMLVVEDIASKERASFTLQTGDLAVIPVRMAHGFRTIVSGQGVEWSTTRFDVADVVPYHLVE